MYLYVASKMCSIFAFAVNAVGAGGFPDTEVKFKGKINPRDSDTYVHAK